MVCLGNICRSPMAEGVLRFHIEHSGKKAIVDSAGTADFHIGEMPDYRAVKTLQSKGIDISGLEARQFKKNDFDEFDFIYVMDTSNLQNVLALARNHQDKNKVSLLLDALHPGMNKSVPDPYYGDISGFEEVYNLIDKASREIINRL